MKKRNIIVTILTAGLILFGASAVSATTIWGTGVTEENDLHSSRTSENGGGAYANGDLADGGFTIAWDIEQLSNGNWSYTYTLNAAIEISHFILEVTQGDDFNIFYANPAVEDQEDGPATPWTESGGIGFNGNEVYGIKFDGGGEALTDVTYTLITDMSPVWGVFFAANEENDTYAWSTALSDHGDYKDNESTVNFIARPDGGTPVPESPTMLLVGVGLIGVAGLGRNNIFKRKKKNR